MVGFVEDVQTIARVRQNSTAAERQVGQYQIVVGDNHIDLLHTLTRLVEHTLLKMPTTAVAALNMIGGQT